MGKHWLLPLSICAGVAVGTAVAAAAPVTLPGTPPVMPPATQPAAQMPPAPASAPAAAADATEPLQEIIIQRPEPRYVAPTRRDRIGRIWAPVYINGKGPFRLVLDTGATHSGIAAETAQELNLPQNLSKKVLLRGATGTAIVPTVRVDSMRVGDIVLDATVLPIITDPLGGAQGILGAEWLSDQSIYIDFRYDLIIIGRSRRQRAERSAITIPFKLMRGNLIVIDARVGGIRTKAIIDTGGQATIGNMALRDALLRRRSRLTRTPTPIEDVTKTIQTGELIATPPIDLGGVQIISSGTTYADLKIFKYWKLTDQPVLLVGMDVLGLLDTLIIDYRWRDLQVRLPARVNGFQRPFASGIGNPSSDAFQ